MTALEILLITLGFTVILFYWVWIFSIRVNNFSVIDAAWSFAFLIHALIFCTLGTGYSIRKLLFLGVMGVWSFRLGAFLAKRIKSHHPHEDTRYLKLREEYGKNYKKRFLYLI